MRDLLLICVTPKQNRGAFLFIQQMNEWMIFTFTSFARVSVVIAFLLLRLTDSFRIHIPLHIYIYIYVSISNVIGPSEINVKRAKCKLSYLRTNSRQNKYANLYIAIIYVCI